MSVFTKALFDKLAGDSALTGMLAEFEGQPAIFTSEPITGALPVPYVVANTVVTDNAGPLETKTTTGRDHFRDIRCYDESSESSERIEDVAERIRELLHRKPVPVTGYGTQIVEVSGPITAPTDETMQGLILQVRLVMQKGG